MHDVEVPGKDGGWFDLVPLSKLGTDQQDEFLEFRDELFETARRKLPPAAADPANPAMTAPQPEVRFSRADLTRLHTAAASYSVQATSFDGVLPWHDGSRAAMGLVAWNYLREALLADGKHWDALLGVVPKPTDRGTTGTSGTSSSGDADAPLPESADGTSGTPTE